MLQKSHQKSMHTGRCLFDTSYRAVLALALFFVLAFNFNAKACSPLNVPTLNGQTVTPTALLLDWSSNTTYQCTYSIQIEIVCANQSFTGLGPFFYTTALTKTVTPQQYPLESISLSNLCPGTAYQLRAREVEAGTNNAVTSLWTSPVTFTTPGTFMQPIVNVQASNNIVCPPQGTQLSLNITNTCGGDLTYSWSPALGLSSTTVASPVATINTSTTYSVMVTGGATGCWSGVGSIDLIVSGTTQPSVGTAFANPIIVCTGLGTELNLSGFVGNIQWQSAPSNGGPWTDVAGARTNSFTTGPLTANTCFQAVVSSCTGTVTSNAFCVTVDQIPTLVPTVMQISCTSSVATANMGAGAVGTPVSATWSPVPLSLGSQSTVATYTTPGTVIVSARFQDGCVATSTMAINPPPPPVTYTLLNVTGSASITCTFSDIALAAISTYTYGSLNYFWSSSSYTASTQSITITAPGTYSCIVTDPVSNCSATHSIQIGQSTAIPTVSVSPASQSVSCGAGVVATATAVALSPTTNVTHNWYSSALPGNPVSSGGAVSIFAPTPGTNTLVLVNNINGCSVMKTITVTSTSAYPTFTINGTYTIGCSSTSLTSVTIQNALGGGGGAVSFTMLPPNYAGGTTYTTSPSMTTYTINSPGTYTLIVKDAVNHCESRVPVSIIQNTFGPVVEALAPTFTLSCFTPSISMIASSTATTPLSYAWTFQNNGNPNTYTNPTITVATGTAPVTSTLVNTYTLQITDQNNACVSTSIVPVYQNVNPPTASIAVQSNIITCRTPSVILNNDSKSHVLPPFTQFQPQIGLLWTGPTPQLPDSDKSTYNAFTPGTYTMVTRDMNNGCVATATTQILDGRIYPIIQADTLVALDCNVAVTGGVALAATVQSLTAGQVSAQWYVPQPPPNIKNANTLTLTTDGVGDYQLVVTTNTNGCSSQIIVNVTPGQLNGMFTPDKESGYAPLTVNFSNSSSSTSSVSGTSSITSVWSFGNGTTKTTTTNASTSAVYTAPGTYTVTMFASKGSCRDTVVKVITVDIPSKLVVPNVFTPNNDGSNDIFFVQASNLTDINCQVFDRWGNKIYDLDSNTGNIAWDGKNQSGHEAPDGTYFYTIKATGKDGQTYNTKGTVSLYR